jgi:hypothetical protein
MGKVSMTNNALLKSKINYVLFGTVTWITKEDFLDMTHYLFTRIETQIVTT